VGGAELGHVSLPAQQAWKLAVLQESFQRFARAEFPGLMHPVPGDHEAAGLRYRTRIGATADAEGRAAMHPIRSKDVRAISAMPLATEEAEAALLGSRFPAGSHVNVIHPSNGDVEIVVNGQRWHKGRADSRVNAPNRVRETVPTRLGDLNYRVSTQGFWQVHRAAAALLVEQVLDRVADAPAAWDLYAGSGLFSIALAAAGKSVVSVEAHGDSSRDAKRNSHAYPQTQVVNADVRRHLAAVNAGAAPGLGSGAAVILDPPRSGAGAKTLDEVAALKCERIVYVACDPVALARDTALLAERGFVLAEAQAFDLFPMTHHMETIATFTR
jgi:tRNA/tmRNA/rRNA uracil-C5-methylase (TrmA/RlmC/RlmD family)